MIPSRPNDNMQPLRRTFCFMLMLHKSSFEKACGNTIWCCSDEITTRQVQEDNLSIRPQMSCVSVVRSSEFELHCPRRSINEGLDIYADNHQCLCTSCCGEGGRIESSLQQKQSWKAGGPRSFAAAQLWTSWWFSDHSAMKWRQLETWLLISIKWKTT